MHVQDGVLPSRNQGVYGADRRPARRCRGRLISVWGHEFEDEFHRSLRHLTGVHFVDGECRARIPTGRSSCLNDSLDPWLDNKHTVFGRVVQGTDHLQGIEKVKTSLDDRPVMDIKILSIMCSIKDISADHIS